MSLTIAKKADYTFVKDIAEVIFAALFLGLFAKVYIHLFFTPVPIVLQNSIALAYGGFLSSKKSALSVLLFILLGVLGLPFFAGGSFGISTLLSTTGGYIIGYAIAAYFVGEIFEMKNLKSTKSISLVILLAHMVILFCGASWLSTFIGMKKAFILGVLPFIAGDVFKTIVITKLIKLKNSYFN